MDTALREIHVVISEHLQVIFLTQLLSIDGFEPLKKIGCLISISLVNL